MSTTMTTFPGFDVEKLEAFNAYAAENPNDVLLGLEARTIWEGHSGESLGKIGPWSLAGNRVEKPTRDYSIQFGAWKEVADAIGVEGARDKIEPVEAALAAVSSCVTWAIAINAAREGLVFDALEVRATAKVDPRVLLGIVPVEEAASCMQKVEMDIQVHGDLTEEDRQRIAQMAKRSPVHALISHPNTIYTNVTVN
jgi:uncharacterized OsmC-like protein